jgi:putative effector of murein hydrolase
MLDDPIAAIGIVQAGMAGRVIGHERSIGPALRFKVSLQLNVLLGSAPHRSGTSGAQG